MKKHEDFYNAYKELVDFFERNNIQLAEKDKVVTRFKWYFFRVLVLKIKEYRFTRIFYLLGFLPMLQSNMRYRNWRVKMA